MMQVNKEVFERDGFVVLKQLFTEQEVQNMKDEARAMLSRLEQVDRSGVYMHMTFNSDVFRQAAQAPKLVPVLKEIIGDCVVFLSDKLVVKDASTDFGSPWHQDYPYWFGSHKYSVWIALDEAVKENGCLRVVPGSHKFGSIEHGLDEETDEGFNFRLKEEEITPESMVDLPARVGDAIVFHDLLYHASYPNISGADRWALISTYKDGNQPDPDYDWLKAPFTLP